MPSNANERERDSITVLVVDNEAGVLIKIRELLAAMRIAVVTAESASEALQIIRTADINVALVDWRLKGHDDGLALGRALRRDHDIPFILFSGYLDTDVVGHAYRAGAADVIDKPLRPGRLLAAIEFALHSPSTPEAGLPGALRRGSDSVARRLARVMLRACSAQDDPNTESAVASEGGVSLSVFCKLCDACDIVGKSARDLVRFLRALARSKENDSLLRTHLAVVDPRTRARLFERAGVPVDARFVPLRDFMSQQKFIPMNKECLGELIHLAANDPLFFAELKYEAPTTRNDSKGRPPCSIRTKAGAR